jgi:hypothetical protein
MKKNLITLLYLIFLISTSCQEIIDVKKEKEAILKVLQEEGTAIAAADIERVYSIHIRDSTATRLQIGVDSYQIYSGWNQIKPLLDGYVEYNKNTPDLKNAKNIKENVIIKVVGNSAWVICDNIWKYDYQGKPEGFNNIQIAFFEKVNNEWKFSFNAFITKPEPKEETAPKVTK